MQFLCTLHDKGRIQKVAWLRWLCVWNVYGTHHGMPLKHTALTAVRTPLISQMLLPSSTKYNAGLKWHHILRVLLLTLSSSSFFFFLDFVYRLSFDKSRRFGSRLCFRLHVSQAPTLVDRCELSLGTRRISKTRWDKHLTSDLVQGQKRDREPASCNVVLH